MAIQTTTTVRGWWSSYRCSARTDTTRNVPDFEMWGKQVGGVPILATQAFKALEMALNATNYTPIKGHWVERLCSQGGIGGAVCQSNGNGCSLHNYRIAIDIEPTLNPQSPGDRFSGKLKEHHVKAVTGIKNTFGEQMWTWGGYWSLPDRMHFQINVPPSRTAVDWTTVLGHTEPSKPEEGTMYHPLIQKTSTPSAIGYMQLLIEVAGIAKDLRSSDGAGVWGPKTEAALKAIGNANQALEGQEHAALIVEVAKAMASAALKEAHARTAVVEAEMKALRIAYDGMQTRLRQVEASAANSAGAVAGVSAVANDAARAINLTNAAIDLHVEGHEFGAGTSALKVGDTITILIESKED